MALTIADADAYIDANCIDIDDWLECDDARKQRIINVADRTLTTKYAQYMVPDAAVFEFANVLATVFNDTVRLMQQGVTAYSIDKVGSFSFKNDLVMSPGSDLSRFIPQTALDIIGAENDVVLSKRNVGWTVL